MFLFIVLVLVVLILIALIIAAVVVGGVVGLLLFGDVIVCVAILIWVIKKFFFDKKGKN